MTTINSKILLEYNAKFMKIAAELYSTPISTVSSRFSKLIAAHSEWCLGESYIFSSPGRIEIAGNHTDHNNGMVVAAAISLDTLAAVTTSNESKIIIKSSGFPDVVVDIHDLEYREDERGTANALVRGVLNSFVVKGYKIGAFSATTVSDVIKGAGVSSSAAFEILTTEILNILYNDGKISPIERASISQFAENVFFGKPSGLMDQAAIALGGISFIDFENPTAPIIKKLNWPFDDVSAVVINCGGDHCDLTQNYASIKSDMESIAKYYGETKLRRIRKASFYRDIKVLKNKFSGRAILRAIHYFEENERVENIVSAIKENNATDFFNLVNASGLSSYTKLQNIYPEGDPSEPVALALAIVARAEGVLASRIHGGGFAGTILTFIDNNYKEDFIKHMCAIFGDANVFDIKIRKQGAIKLDL
ncbi:MAG: galactokinase [Christensenellaceae bacterium]|jgi:galactokinase|nr:galactokinase [Christensenellaceae bacterium]